MTSPIPPVASSQEVRLVRRYSASPQRVFDAWVDPKLLCQWFGAGPQVSCDGCELDPRVGGHFRIAMSGEGRQFVIVGNYLEFDPPRRLVFTFSWELPADAVKNTRVSLDFRAVADGVELTLIHAGLPSEKSRQSHAGGWTGCLDRLGRFFAAPSA